MDGPDYTMDMQAGNECKNEAVKAQNIKHGNPKQYDPEEVITYYCQNCEKEVKGRTRWSNFENDMVVDCDECGQFIQIFIAYRTQMTYTKGGSF